MECDDRVIACNDGVVALHGLFGGATGSYPRFAFDGEDFDPTGGIHFHLAVPRSAWERKIE
ncbi:MAG: hypothetical protein V1800_03380 [Candidatus Latescibacterota bacterium]